MSKWRDEDTLRELYHEQGLSSREMADELGCTKTTILNWMDKFGLEKETPDRDKPPCYSTHNEGYRAWFHDDGDGLKTVLEHRLLAVAEFGFDALYNNVVHHQNGCKIDNRPSNIELMSRSGHMNHHRPDIEPQRLRAIRKD